MLSEIFLQKGLDSPVTDLPDRPISRSADEPSGQNG
jgi:hypothetical protein